MDRIICHFNRQRKQNAFGCEIGYFTFVIDEVRACTYHGDLAKGLIRDWQKNVFLLCRGLKSNIGVLCTTLSCTLKTIRIIVFSRYTAANKCVLTPIEFFYYIFFYKDIVAEFHDDCDIKNHRCC